MSDIKEGVKAPNFSGVDQNGNTVKLLDFSGKTLIVYFYPKDNTPGCTNESIEFQSLIKQFDEQNALIFGAVASLLGLKEKYFGKQIQMKW